MMEKSLWSVRAEIARPKALTVLVAAALAAVYAGVPASAWADGGRGSTITTNQPGGAGGIDGDAASATGKMGNSLNNPLGSAGGGGGVNLTTGAGAAGGPRGIGSTGTQTAGGTAGATGATAATYSTAQTVTSNLTGGNGGAGSANNAATTLGGGGGGGVGISTTADLVIAAGTITGGRGYSTMYVGSGGGGVGVFSSAHVTVQAGGRVVGGAGGGTAALGGAGGGGGMGVLLTAGGSVDNFGTIIGGDGGTASTTGFTGGGAGDGGAGVQLTAAGTVFNSGAITGGVGGKGPGNFTGAPGGAGVRFSAGGSLLNTGIITGGAGGGTVTLGTGAAGGAGVLFSAGGTVVNQGTISGGAGGSSVSGAGGPGGAGIRGSDVTVINAGLIRGAISGTPGTSTQAAAIQFTGGVNVLEIQAGSVLNGNALAYSSADTLRLGGGTDSSFDVASLGAAASGAQYQGFGVYEKSGASTWALTGTTAMSTSWTVTGGALSISDDASLGAASGTLTLNGGTLQNTAAIAASRAIVLDTSGGTLQTDADYTGTGIISGAGGLTKTGAATLTLSGANTYTGGTTITAGTVAISADENLGAAQSGVALNGGTLQTTAAISMNRDMVLGADGGTLRTDADLSNGSEISGVGGLTKTGAGTLTLSGANSYTGGTTVTAGTLVISANENLGAAQGGVVLNSGTLHTTAAMSMSRDIVLGAAGGMLRTDADLSNGGEISGVGGLTKTGAGTLTLSGANSYTGGTTVTAGTLVISANENLGAAQGGVVLNSGTLQTTAAMSMSRDIVLGAAGGMLRTDADLSSGGEISGVGGLTKTGAGTLTLSGANSYAGGTTVTAGTVAISANENLGAAQSGVVLNSGTLQTTAAMSMSRDIVLGTAGGTLRTDADLSNGGQISGVGGLTKTGAGTLTLNGANSYTGGTMVTAGTVAISANENLGAAQSSVVLNGGTLQTTAAMSISRDIVLGADGGTLRTDADLVNGGGLSGVGGLTKAGAGTLTLTGPITYLGTTTIQEGTLLTPAVNLGGNDITNNGTLALQQDSAGQLDGAINGTGNLIKLGTGRLNLTGGGDMSGTTYVQAGTLSINSSLANSAVEVDAGGTLGGNGTVGAITVRGGGSVAPGNSIGTLRVNGNFVQEAGSTYVVEFDNTSSDQIAVNGTATVQSGAGLMAVKGDSSGSLLKAGTKYTVLSTTGGLTGTYTLSQTPLTAFLGVRDSYDANNAYLTVVQMRDPAEAAVTPNQEATAGGSAGSVVSDVVLNSPTDDAARDTLDQLSGAALASAKGAMVYDSRYSRDLAIDRLRNAFCTVGAESTRGEGHGDGGADSAANRGGRLGTCGTGDAAGRVAWSQTWGGWGHTNGNSNAGGIDRNSAGFVVGMDVPVGSWRVGGLTGYSHGRYKVDDQNARTESDDFHLGVYGGTQWGALALRLGGVYTFHDVNSGRDVNVAPIGGRMKADYQANTTQAFGELGYQLKAGPVALEPFVNLAYVNLHTNAFNERGGEAALSSRSTDTSTSFSTLGLRASSDLRLGKIDATVRGLLGWRRAYGDVTPKSKVSFNGGDTFTVSGVPIGKDAAVIGAGLDLHITPRVTAGVAFDGQFGSGASDRTVSGTIRVVF